MAEGDPWANATDSTIHLEKEVKSVDTPLETKVSNVVYWCGFLREPKHHRIEGNEWTLTYASIDTRTCQRCIRNRKRATQRGFIHG